MGTKDGHSAFEPPIISSANHYMLLPATRPARGWRRFMMCPSSGAAVPRVPPVEARSSTPCWTASRRLCPLAVADGPVDAYPSATVSTRNVPDGVRVAYALVGVRGCPAASDRGQQ